MWARGRIAALHLLALAAIARAADDGADAPEEEQEVTVVVTASKHGQKITEAPASVTVLTAEDIEASGAVTLPDLFRRVPGMDFAQISARDYNVNARGFVGSLSRRLLVLVDGRSVYLDIMGFTLWDSLGISLDDVERIEIVRGPGSALYGANASSGVVSIVTKSPRDIDGTLLRLGYGEATTVDVGFLHGQGIGSWGYKLSGGYFSTEPFPGPEKPYLDPALARSTDNATRQPRGTARLEWEGERGGKLTFDAGYGSTTGILLTGIGPLEIQPGSHLSFLRAAYAREGLFVQAFWNGLGGETLNLTTGQQNVYATDSYDVEIQWNRGVGRHFFVLGGNARHSSVTTDLASRDETELLYGLYAQDEVDLGHGVTVNAALRVDHDELVGTVLAPKGGIVYAPSDRHSFRLTAATAYNSSSFIESYLDFQWSIPLGGGATYDVFAYGNPDLEPERNTTYELGYRAFPLPGMLLDATVFYARLKDFSSFLPVEYYVYPDFPKGYSYVNVGRASQRGLELAVETLLPRGFGLAATYSFTDTSDDSDVAGVTAKNKAALTLQYARHGRDGLAKGLWGSLSVVYTDETVYTLATPFYPAGTVPSYTVVNGAVYWDLLDDDRLAVGIRGTNLLDKKHQQYIVGDYVERRVLAEVKLRF